MYHYGSSKKAVFHVLRNRVNDLGFDLPEAYGEIDPFKPDSVYLKKYSTHELNVTAQLLLLYYILPDQVNAITTLFL